jgi:hypothetical protein
MATHAETPNVQINRLRCAIREAWNHTLQDTFDLGHDLDNNALCTLLAPYTTGAAYDSILGGDYKACRALLADHSPAAAATWDDFAGPHKQLMMRLFVDLLRVVNYVNGCLLYCIIHSGGHSFVMGPAELPSAQVIASSSMASWSSRSAARFTMTVTHSPSEQKTRLVRRKVGVVISRYTLCLLRSVVVPAPC